MLADDKTCAASWPELAFVQIMQEEDYPGLAAMCPTICVKG